MRALWLVRAISLHLRCTSLECVLGLLCTWATPLNPGRTMLMGLVSKAMRKQISLRHRSTENLKLKFQHFFYVLGGTLKRILFIVDTAA